MSTGLTYCPVGGIGGKSDDGRDRKSPAAMRWEVVEGKIMLSMKTSFVGSDTDIKWCVVDANGKVLGRLATQIAMMLRGKHHPSFTPHADMGYRVAVINAEKVVVTGNKATDKTYFRYSGYPGGAKVRTFEEQMQKKPEDILRHAVKGMLPKNRLGRKLIKKLKIYVGPNHPHQAQSPEVLDV